MKGTRMLYYSLDKDAHQPRFAYEGDAGMDLALKHDLTVPVGAHRMGDTVSYTHLTLPTIYSV